MAAAPLAAQTYIGIVSVSGFANALITTTVPVSWQYGANTGTTNTGVDCSVAPGCWIKSAAPAILTSFPTLFSTFPSDPAPGISKIFEIAEQAGASFNVSVNNGGVITQVTVPAIPGSVTPTVYSPTYRAGSIYPIAFSKISVITGSPAATLLSTFSIPAYQFVAGVLQNFNMTVNIGVVPFSCTYASTTTAGIITMNCSPVQK
jgi:hypothetical protein